MKMTTKLIVTSAFLKDSADTNGRRPEPIRVLRARRMRTQKIVVLALAAQNFLNETFSDQPSRKRKGAVTEEINLET